jgi:uncharacterized protein (DUF433 family)
VSQPAELLVQDFWRGRRCGSVDDESSWTASYTSPGTAIKPWLKNSENLKMPLTIQTDPLPLRTDESGVIRVGKSQVVLDVVIDAFNKGADPASIVQGYSTLELADVHAVIAYYLRHRPEVDEYLHTRQKEAQRLRQEIEAGQPGRSELREKLLARKAQMELQDASPGD